jgi:mannose-6-phosphate isomerase-like protein (cupin superfamily)
LHRQTGAVDVFAANDLRSRISATEGPWLEFFRSEALSVGLYVLGIGEPDEQVPHHEDEIYVVQRGRATVTIAGEDQAVGPGDVIFVGREVDHRFHHVTEELALVVVFAPPESGE